MYVYIFILSIYNNNFINILLYYNKQILKKDKCMGIRKMVGRG